MSESQPPPARLPGLVLAGRDAALRLGLALLLALALVLVFVARDRTRRTALERAEEVTGVGDAVYFQPPSSAEKQTTSAASWNGKVLYLVSDKPHELSDSKMRRVARDPASGLSIYRSPAESPGKGDAGGKEAEQFYYLKTAPRTYLRARASTKSK